MGSTTSSLPINHGQPTLHPQNSTRALPSSSSPLNDITSQPQPTSITPLAINKQIADIKSCLTHSPTDLNKLQSSHNKLNSLLKQSYELVNSKIEACGHLDDRSPAINALLDQQETLSELNKQCEPLLKSSIHETMNTCDNDIDHTLSNHYTKHDISDSYNQCGLRALCAAVVVSPKLDATTTGAPAAKTNNQSLLNTFHRLTGHIFKVAPPSLPTLFAPETRGKLKNEAQVFQKLQDFVTQAFADSTEDSIPAMRDDIIKVCSNNNDRADMLMDDSVATFLKALNLDAVVISNGISGRSHQIDVRTTDNSLSHITNEAYEDNPAGTIKAKLDQVLNSEHNKPIIYLHQNHFTLYTPQAVD